ncbi:MAG: hypothetical protein WBB82_17095 [Limnothrix sp.]
MIDVLKIIGLTMIGGICIPLGGFLASIENIHRTWLEQEFRHFVIALGGGILLGAVSQVLIPEGIAYMGQSLWTVPITVLGGVFFFGVEQFLASRQQDAPQMTGMLLDYVPEAIALGGLVATGSSTALLLAILMGFQNLPEGFNTYRELRENGQHKSRQTLIFMCKLVAIGPIAGLSGFFFLANYPYILGALMLFASGGILYLIFQDIAPQCPLKKHWFPPLGAVFGFCIAMFSHLLLGSV